MRAKYVGWLCPWRMQVPLTCGTGQFPQSERLHHPAALLNALLGAGFVVLSLQKAKVWLHYDTAKQTPGLLQEPDVICNRFSLLI